MGGSISRRFNRKKNTAHRNERGAVGQPKNAVDKFANESTGPVRSNYNTYTIGLHEAKSEDVEDALLKAVMRNQLALDSQVFVLNQMLLGVQFFSNYDV